MDSDLRQALRRLFTAPGFSLTVIATLALGIGATTAIFSVCYGVLLKPMPYPDPGELVFINESEPQVPEMSVAYPNYLDYRSQSTVFDEVGIYNRASYNLTGSGEPERIQAGQTSASLFRVTRVAPLLGRVFTDEEDRPGAPHVVVLGEGLWERRFGRDPSIVGRKVDLNGEPYTVIGVMPRAYRMPTRIEMWVPVGPLSASEAWNDRGNHPGLFGVARLKAGVTLEAARNDLGRVSRDLARAYPKNALTTARLTPLLDIYVADSRRILLVLLAAVFAVLMIACANVASLMLVRLTSRQKELAVRQALGASTGQLVRNTLAETLVLALVGGALGVLVARASLAALMPLASELPRAFEIAIDGRALALTFTLSALSGLAVGLLPALSFRKRRLLDALLLEGRGSTGHRTRARAALVVAEMALTVVLLVAAGLLLRSFDHLLNVAPGFDVDQAVVFAVSLPDSRYADLERRAAFIDSVLGRLEAIPGVEMAAASTGLPLGENGWQTSFYVEGRGDPAKLENWKSMEFMVVSPSYFKTMGMKVLAGAPFDRSVTARSLAGADLKGLAEDERQAARVDAVVVDEAFARSVWPGENAVGKRIRWSPKAALPALEVKAVVGRVRMDGIAEDTKRVQAYASMLQLPMTDLKFTLRTTLPPSAVVAQAREVVRQVDPAQPIFSVRTLGDLRDSSLAPARLSFVLLGIFAAVALALALIGVFGIMSYSVAQQTREIGVRLALGARVTQVAGLVVRQGLRLAMAGAVFGVAVAAGLAGVMGSLLYEVSPRDPITFATAVVLLLATAVLAAYLPARRAASVDPAAALRAE